VEKFGKYEVLSKIGEGGFGVVYKGQDPHLKRHVAIKTCSMGSQEDRLRFFREAEISANLHHPNITMVYDFGFEAEVPYFVQEYLTGRDLSEIIRAREALAFEDQMRILEEVATGLAYAHEQGIVHRDVKPANIRVLENGKVKIMDFGIARATEGATRITKTGVSVGTPAYLSPEQLEGEEADQRADIFAFGVMAYELLTMERAFRGPTVSAMMYQILHEEPVPIDEIWPECPAKLCGVVRGSLRKSRDARFASFHEVLRELRAVRAEVGDSPPVGPQLTSRTEVVGPRSKQRGAKSGRKLTRAVREDQTAPVASRHRGGAIWLAAAALILAVVAVVVMMVRSTGTGERSVAAVGDLVSPSATAPVTIERPGVAEAAVPIEVDVRPPAVETAPPETAGSFEELAPPDDPTTLAALVDEARARAESARVAAVNEGAAMTASEAFEVAGRQFDRAAMEVGTEQFDRALRSYLESSESFLAAQRLAVEAKERAAAEPLPAASVSVDPAPSKAGPDPADVTDPPAPSDTTPAIDPEPSLGGPGRVAVDEQAARDGVRKALAAYEAAYEALDGDALRSAWPGISDDRLHSTRQAFRQYRSFQMDLSDCRIEAAIDSATATCTVRQVVQPRSGSRLTNESSRRFELSRQPGGGWVIDRLE